MFLILIFKASHSLSDERTKYLVKDRLSFMRFLGLSLADRVPDANSIWNFREALTRAVIGGVPAIEALFRRFEAQLSAAGYIAMGGQIVDATVVAAPKQRNTEDESLLKGGRIPEAWAAKPAKLAQKDRDARWTVKYTKAKPSADGAKRVDIAIPTFGYKNQKKTTDAARHDGVQLPSLLDRANTGSGVWADTAYRSAKNEAHLEAGGFRAASTKEAHGQADAQACLPRQRREVRGPRPCRARLHPPEGPHGAGHPNDGARPGDGEDRAREPRLQHAPNGLARQPTSAGLKHGRAGAARRTPRPIATD